MSEMNGNMIGGDHYYKSVEPTNTNKKGFKLPNGMGKLAIIIGSVVAGVAIIGGVAAAAMLNTKPAKVASAIEKTLLDGGYLAEDLQKAGDISDKCTYRAAVDADISAYGTSFSVNAESEVIFDGKTKQVYAAASLPGGADFEALAEINKKDIKFEIPELDDRTYVYTYMNGDNEGLEELVGEENLEQLNEALETLYNATASGQIDSKEIKKIITKRIKALEYEDAGTETFTVDGKDRKCAGITVTVTGDDIYMLCEDLLGYLEENYAEDFETMMTARYGSSVDTNDILEEIEEELEYFPDYEFTVYLYKGKLAAIDIPVYGDTYVEVCFEGGDFRLQNIEVYAVSGKEEQQILEIAGSRDGKTDTFKLKTNGQSLGKFTYNHKTGEFEVSLGQYLGNIEFEGKLICSSKGFELTMEIPTALIYEVSYTSISGDITIAYEKGAKLHKFKGDKFDIGDCDEDDLEEIARDWSNSELANMIDYLDEIF